MNFKTEKPSYKVKHSIENPVENAVHSGEWLNRLTNDTVVVADSYVEILPGLVGMVVKLISAVIMMVVLDWRFACVLLPCGVLLIVFTYAFRKVLKKLHKQVQERDGKLRIFLQEHIGSLMMIRSFATEQQTEDEASDKMLQHKTARMRKNHFSKQTSTLLPTRWTAKFTVLLIPLHTVRL